MDFFFEILNISIPHIRVYKAFRNNSVKILIKSMDLYLYYQIIFQTSNVIQAFLNQKKTQKNQKTTKSNWTEIQTTTKEIKIQFNKKKTKYSDYNNLHIDERSFRSKKCRKSWKETGKKNKIKNLFQVCIQESKYLNSSWV